MDGAIMDIEKPELRRTNSVKKHSHVAYIRPDGTGITSTDNGHAHRIEYRELNAVGDPQSGAILAEQKAPQWFVIEEKGHSHVLVGALEPAPAPKEDDDAAVVKKVHGLFKEAKDEEADFRKMAEESEGFVSGESQWDKKDRRKLEKERRACLTINEIEGKVDLLCGYQRQNRYDIHYFPVEGGDSRVADILNALSKVIFTQNSFDYEETESFEDSVIAGRGLWNLYDDFDTDIQGNIVIEHFPWGDVWFGPHSKKDLRDLEYLIKGRWYSLRKIKSLWPDKANDISRDYDNITSDSVHERVPGRQYVEGNGRTVPTTDPDLVDIARKEFRVLECWEKVYSVANVVVNAQDDFYYNAKCSAKDITAIKTIPGIRVVPRNVTRMKITRIAGDTLLDSEFPNLPEGAQDFHIIPIYAKKRGKRVWGKVEAGKDMQREINKRHSQGVDILTRMDGYGWFYDQNTFPDDKAKQEFREKSATSGFTLEVNNVSSPPSKVEGTRFPAELAQYETLATQQLERVMNVSGEMMGMNSNAESGVAIAEKRRQGLIGNEFLYDNLALAKRKLGRLLVAHIQKLYTPERIMRILNAQNAQNLQAKQSPIQVGGQPLDAYGPEELQALLENSDLTKYDVVVGESAFSPTTRRANFILWSELARGGMPVPPDMLIDLSDLPDKEKVKAAFAAQVQAQQQAEQAKQQTEIVKTMIAKNNQGQGDTGAQ